MTINFSDQLETTALPLLALRTGVILPHMVVTLMLETEDARQAVAAAQAADGVLVAVPRLDSGFAPSALPRSRRRPAPSAASRVIRGCPCIVRPAFPGPAGPRGSGGAPPDHLDPRPTAARDSGAIEHRRGPRRSRLPVPKGITEPAPCRHAGYPPYLSLAQNIAVSGPR